MNQPITARQAEILAFVRAFIGRQGQAPTVREIAAHFGLVHHNTVTCILRALERKGAVHRVPYERRGIRIVEEARQ